MIEELLLCLAPRRSCLCRHNVRLSAHEAGPIVLLWPAALLVILLCVNKCVRDEYETK